MSCSGLKRLKPADARVSPPSPVRTPASKPPHAVCNVSRANKTHPVTLRARIVLESSPERLAVFATALALWLLQTPGRDAAPALSVGALTIYTGRSAPRRRRDLHTNRTRRETLATR